MSRKALIICDLALLALYLTLGILGGFMHWGWLGTLLLGFAAGERYLSALRR